MQASQPWHHGNLSISLTPRRRFAAIHAPRPGRTRLRSGCPHGPIGEPQAMTAPSYEKLSPPRQGTRVTVDGNGKWQVPDDPIVCLLRGDGIGRDVGGTPGITTCAVRVLDAAVDRAYQGKRRIHWFDVHAGDVARHLYRPEVRDEQVGKL